MARTHAVRVAALRALALLSALLASGCSVVLDQERELWIRHDREADTVEALVVMRGVCAAPDKLPRAVQVVSGVLDGKRQLGFGAFTSIDLDVDPDEEEIRPGDRELVDAIEVRSEAFLDEEQRLCVAQHVRIPQVARGLDRINQVIRDELLEDHDPDQLDASEAEGAALRYGAAAAGWTFVRFDGPQLVVRLPVTEAETAEYFRDLMRTSMRERRENGLWFALSSIRLEDGCATLAIGEPDEREWHVELRDTNLTYTADLRDALVAAGRTIPARHVDDVRLAFLSRPDEPPAHIDDR